MLLVGGTDHCVLGPAELEQSRDKAPIGAGAPRCSQEGVSLLLSPGQGASASHTQTHTPTEELPPGRDPQSRASNVVPGKIQQTLHRQQQFMEGSRKTHTELFFLDQRGPSPGASAPQELREMQILEPCLITTASDTPGRDQGSVF